MNALELLTSRCMRTEPAKIVTPSYCFVIDVFDDGCEYDDDVIESE